MLDAMENVFQPDEQPAFRALMEVEFCKRLYAGILRKQGAPTDPVQMQKRCSCSVDLSRRGRPLPADQHDAALATCDSWSKTSAARSGKERSPFHDRADRWDVESLRTVYDRCWRSEPRTGSLRAHEVRSQYCGCLVDAARFRGGTLARPFSKVGSQDRAACRTYSQEVLRRYERVRSANRQRH
jgi:hypothetical protein